jgi:hypothetical protein
MSLRDSLLALCLSPCLTFASSQAILVGVQGYKEEPLRGSSRDVEKMTRLLKGYGFQSFTPLVGKDASHDEITKALKTSITLAHQGDQIVFYFSGKGAVGWDKSAPGRIDMAEPLLVPLDGLKNDTSNDIRFSQLEAWSHQIMQKGATPIVMVDACFVDPTRAFFEGKAISPPKVFKRAAFEQVKQTRTQLYKGEGVFICSGGPQGGAYEWQASIGTDHDWEGAFTSVFYDRARVAQNRREAVSYIEILNRTQWYFKQAQHMGYLLGLLPYPMETMLSDDKRPSYSAIAFNAKSLPVPDDGLRKEMEARRNSRETLRILVNYDAEKQDADISAAEGAVLAKSLVKETKAAIQSSITASKVNARVISEDQDLPDVVVNVSKSGNQVRIRLYGDIQDQSTYVATDGDPTYLGKDVQSAVADAMEQYIVPHGLYLLLFRLHEDEHPSLTELSSIQIDQKSPLQPDTNGNYLFHIQIKAPKEACMFLIDQDEIDGRAQLVFPVTEDGTGRVANTCFQFFHDPANSVESAGNTAGVLSGGACKETPGAVRLRAVFVQATGEPLPVLNANDSVKQLCDCIAKVLDGIRRGVYKWRTSEVQYRVKGPGGTQ